MSVIRGCRVVVTGGAGFLGRHLCLELERRDPASLMIPRSRDYDLRDLHAVQQLFADSRPNIVIHLAAKVGGIGANRANPGQFFYDNAIMGIQVLEQARLAGVAKFVVVGTVCSYPRNTAIPFREEDLWNGYPEETNAPYGLAKKMLLVQAQAYRQEYGFNAITLLPVNLYGPGDNFDPTTGHVIPSLIRKAIAARDAGHSSIDVWGTGNAFREFLFVRDAAEAIASATDNYDRPEPVNLGSGNEVAIRDLVKLICKYCDFRGEIRWEEDKPDGQLRRCLDTSRALHSFGFMAKTRLEEGLAETISWYQSNLLVR
ncbi:MAG: GDP-L-fucose synthase [Planctomycetes bacterium]|nr:GDP-L-fucose synthase [Planctomycetota bacterium]